MKSVLHFTAIAAMSSTALLAQPAVTLGSLEVATTRGGVEETILLHQDSSSSGDADNEDLGVFTKDDELVVADPFLVATLSPDEGRITSARIVLAASVIGGLVTLRRDTIEFAEIATCADGRWRSELDTCKSGDVEWGSPETRIFLPLNEIDFAGRAQLRLSWQVTTELDGEATTSSTPPLVVDLSLEEALPVELTSFTAAPIEAGVELAWSTATETNNRGFGVERSTDSENWREVAFVAGAGDSKTSIAYSVTDEVSLGTTPLYYRLRQEDLDQTTSYSAIEVVEPTQRPESSFSILPNFARENTTLTNLSETQRKVELIDGSGRRVRSFKLSAGESVNVDVDQLPAGIYSLVSGSVTKSLLVQ